VPIKRQTITPTLAGMTFPQALLPMKSICRNT
jgi:hypothetical protein